MLTLGSALALASQTAPPTVEVRDCLTVETGAPVIVLGIVVDMRAYDSGTEALTILDRAGGPRVKVVCLSGVASPLSERLVIGDLVRVEGEVSRDASDTVVFTTAGQVTQVLRPELVLSVELLCENWRVFEFDRFNISGALVSTDSGYRLQGLSGGHSIELRLSDTLAAAAGAFVLVDVTLLVDQTSMVIFLRAHAMTVM
ncbi:TPA: hypothetical protein HA259_02825 [Thermoplasmata archaeon]|nr:hypothetical protein [Thermoplasmata archaeon]